MIKFLTNKTLADSINPILRIECQAVPEAEFAECKAVGEMMLEVMYSRRGVGLAGPQIGIPFRIFVMNATKPLIVINPEILEYSERKTIYGEGCLSLPGLHVAVERPKSVKIKFWEPGGKEIKCLFDGWSARVFQHEFDHLRGVLITDYKDAASASSTTPESGQYSTVPQIQSTEKPS